MRLNIIKRDSPTDRLDRTSLDGYCRANTGVLGATATHGEISGVRTCPKVPKILDRAPEEVLVPEKEVGLQPRFTAYEKWLECCRRTFHAFPGAYDNFPIFIVSPLSLI